MDDGDDDNWAVAAAHAASSGEDRQMWLMSC